MKNIMMAFFASIAIIACKNIDIVTSQEIDINGHEGWLIKCPDHPERCYTKAGKTCLKGYTVISETINGDFKIICR